MVYFTGKSYWCWLSLHFVCIYTLYTYLFLKAGKGMLRSMIGDFNAVADIIPVDYCANMMLAIAWHRVVKRWKLGILL